MYEFEEGIAYAELIFMNLMSFYQYVGYVRIVITADCADVLNVTA